MSLHAADIENERARRPLSAAELRGELDRALERVELNEQDAAAWRDIGHIRWLLRVDDDAVTAFERALELDQQMEPKHWLALAFAATRSMHYDSALRALEELTRLSPGEPAFWIFRSMTLENLGRADEATAARRRAAMCDTEKPENRVAIAFALGLLDRYDEALALDEKAIQDNEANAWAWVNKGLHLAKKGEPVESVRLAFDRAVAAAPSDATILRNYGVALGDLGLYDEARERLEEALERNPDDVATLRSLGFVLTRLGEHTAALEHDTRAVELAPRHPVAWRSKGVDLFHLKRYEEALHAFGRAAEHAPAGPDMWHAAGSALWKLAQYAEAADAFRRATSSDGSPPDAWLGLAASLDALERHGEALAALRQAVALSPERPELWSLLGRTYRKLGNAVAAEHAFRRGFELETVDALAAQEREDKALDSLAVMASGVVDALAAQGREEKALEFLAEKMEHHRDQALVAYLRGILLMRLGREDEAIAALETADRRWRTEGVRDARATTVARALETHTGPRRGASSWSEHWFGRRSDKATRVLGTLLVVALFAALAVPLAVPDALAPLKYGVGWAAVMLPVTVLIVLLVLPSVQTIKAGGGSFEITTIVLAERDQLALVLPSEIRIDKIADLPSLHAGAVGLGDLLPPMLESDGAGVALAPGGRL